MNNRYLKLWIFVLIISSISCESDLDLLESVYHTDFETNNDPSIVGATYSSFNNSQVIGPFNSDGFNIYLSDLPKHNQILLSFDLYIHDSWDGNAQDLGGPDLWSITVNPFNKKDISISQFITTFSNSGCDSERCLHQSYPEDFPFNNGPRTGSYNINLPGLCSLSSSSSGTSLYVIEKSFYHVGEDAIIRFEDQLRQANTADPKCDESWSMDNLKIWIADYK